MSKRSPQIPLEQLDEASWLVPRHGEMRVPGKVFADAAQMRELRHDPALQQVVNVAHLPGVVGHAMAMPDIHWGYGFPIGGVAATDPAAGGVVSPGGVGYDINCGVRLLRSDLRLDEIDARIPELLRKLYHAVPCGLGVGSRGGKLGETDLKRIFRDGAGWAVQQGLGEASDLEHCESHGAMPGADPTAVSSRARDRGKNQLGTLGSGNHFLELQVVEEVLDASAAQVLGLELGNLSLMIHSGSRGLGHQVCTDALKDMGQAAVRHRVRVPDRQLAAVPVHSPEGEQYLAAMAAAANFAWCNRQLLMHQTIETLEQLLGDSRAGLGLRLVYDLAHNIAKFERHQVDGETRSLLVHRKGATRAVPPRGELLPPTYREIGQPVLIPGDMGRASYVCVGLPQALDATFGSSCHGAGRRLSRGEARRRARGRDLFAELRDRGVEVCVHGRATLAEEMPEAYKDVSQVVGVMAAAGVVKPVVKLRPVGVIKG